MPGIIIRRKLEHRHTQREDGHMKMAAEFAVKQLQGKGHQGLQATTRTRKQ